MRKKEREGGGHTCECKRREGRRDRNRTIERRTDEKIDKRRGGKLIERKIYIYIYI